MPLRSVIKMKEASKNIVTFCITLFVLFVILEIVLRVFIIGAPLENSGDQLHILLEDSERTWGLNPDANGVQSGGAFSINSFGFRDKEYSPTKPDETLRIAVVGDSVTFGKGVDQDKTYAKVLERKLNGDCTQHIEVLNFGVYAYNTFREYAAIKEQVMHFNPDLIVMLYVLNDPELDIDLGLNKTVKQKSLVERVREGLTNNVYTYQFLARIYFASQALNQNLSLNILSYYPMIHSDEFAGWTRVVDTFGELHELSVREDVPVVIFMQPELYRLERDYPFLDIHEQVIETAHANGLRAFDLYPYFKGKRTRSLRVHNFQDRHPNDEGHDIIAHGMLSTLREEQIVSC